MTPAPEVPKPAPRGAAAHPRRPAAPPSTTAGEIRQIHQRIHEMGGDAAKWSAQEVVQGQADAIRAQLSGGAKTITAKVPGGGDITMTPGTARQLMQMPLPPRPPWWPGGSPKAPAAEPVNPVPGATVFSGADIVPAFKDAQQADFSMQQIQGMVREADKNGASRDFGDGYRIHRVGEDQYVATVRGKPLVGPPAAAR